MTKLQTTLSSGLVSLLVAGSAFASDVSTKGSMVGNTKVETKAEHHEGDAHEADCTTEEARATEACKKHTKGKKKAEAKAHKEEHHDEKKTEKSGT